MISSWDYIAVPDGVNLATPLMPLRNTAQDVGWPGVDLAWQLEVLSVWYKLLGHTPSARAMSAHPAASDVNHTHVLAADIVGSYLNRCLLGGLPSASTPISAAEAAAQSFPHRFQPSSALPADVARGGPLSPATLQGMHRYMAGVKALYLAPSLYNLASVTAAPDSLGILDIDRWGYNLETLTPRAYDFTGGQIFRHYNYYSIVGLPGGYMAGGYAATPARCADISIALPQGFHARYFSAATVFLPVRVSGTVNYDGYFPVTATLTETSGALTATVAGASVLGLINRALAHFSITPVRGGNTDFVIYMYIDDRPGIVLPFAADYVVPTAA